MLLKNATFLNSEMKWERGDLWIQNGKIRLLPAGNDAEDAVNCEDYLIVPGLVNAHFHGYSPLARGLVKDTELQDWFDGTVPGKIRKILIDYIDNVLSEEDFLALCQKSYVDMVKGGVTFVSESDPGPSPFLHGKAINEIGIRGIIDVYEKIGEYAGRRDGRVIYGSHLLEEEDISEEELEKCRERKAEYDPVMMAHCLENKWRHDLVHAKYDRSSVKLYDERGLLDDKTVLFHAVYLSDADLDLLAENGCSVVHCPLSNLGSGAGLAKVKEMLDKGINVCLGTDYAHTDLWEVMRFTYYLLKIRAEVSRFTAEDVFQMAAANGAKAYRMDKEIGQIGEGRCADLVFIKKDLSFFPLLEKGDFSTILHNLLLYGKEDCIRHVMVDGKWVMKDRKMVTVDEEALNEKFAEVTEGFFRYLNKEWGR